MSSITIMSDLCCLCSFVAYVYSKLNLAAIVALSALLSSIGPWNQRAWEFGGSSHL